MGKLTKVFNYFDKITIGISTFSLFIMMVWIFVDVMLRTLFNITIQGTIELTGEYLMVLIVFFAISDTHKVDGHVKVTSLVERFSKRMKNIVKVITNLIGACLFLVISILNYQEGLSYLEMNIKSVGVLGYPLAPALFIISLGLLMITLRLLIECIAILFPNIGISSSTLFSSTLSDPEKEIKFNG
ncbi:TRAP-type C4-dicarboxylate transport system permease small subunit [Neobacillus niacini]|uniref:TRAP transporter small permease n=1 Tax=Neobacillus niacini TaxID=86668 RepID=UPI002865AF6F|nr:TRAP transporter small permease [Neobacillus niacini]MDR7076134.1 TRAP-type C4-dicarboxylate transport system permease small subunit [Neobacillus niacini]